MRTLLRSAAGAAVLTSIAITATACSSSSEAVGTAPRVASLATTTAAPSADHSPSTRPRLRLDMTDAEEMASYQPYLKCMREHGAETDKTKLAREGKTINAKKNEAADKICNPQYYPQQPWEEDPANPDSRKFFQLAVQCLKDKGVRYVDAGENGHEISLGGRDNDARSISLGMQYAEACERQAAQQIK